MLHSALPPAEEITLLPLADIARGGMGMVQLCRATDGRLSGRALAVKRLNPALEEESEFVNMFLDETWITSTIDSPNVVKVEAWGRDDDGLFLAVELVQGVSLSRLMKESKEKQEPFAERTVAFIAAQICDGLKAAHELRGENGALLGLVHRDLTPGNVLVSFDGMVKIADFGIAKAEERLTNTRIGMMKGKPAYMAPEQARGGGIDARADIFALGVVIFELLTGRRPWTGANDLETLVAVSTTEPPKLADLRKTSPIFTEIVDKCLRKNPTQRYGTAAEVKQLIDAWRRERNFDRDDQQSLAAFVQRNTAQQQAWFQEALSGQLVKGGVTFMDLEARIDKARKKAEAAMRATGGSGQYGALSSPQIPSPQIPSQQAPSQQMSSSQSHGWMANPSTNAPTTGPAASSGPMHSSQSRGFSSGTVPINTPPSPRKEDIRQSGSVHRPLATVPMQLSDLQRMQNAGAPPQVNADEDDDARTRFLHNAPVGPAAPAAPGAGLVSTLFSEQSANVPARNVHVPVHQSSPNLGALGSTVALTPEEASAMSSRLAAASPAHPSMTHQSATPAGTGHVSQSYAGIAPPGAGPPQQFGGLSGTMLAEPPSGPGGGLSGATMLADAPFNFPAPIPPPPPPQQARQKSGGSGALIGVIVLLLLAGLGAIFYFVIRPRYLS